MDLEDLATSEVVIAIAATAAVLSTRARRVARRGLVYGVAGALSAGDMLMSFGKGMAAGVQDVTESAKQAAQQRTDDGAQESSTSTEESRT